MQTLYVVLTLEQDEKAGEPVKLLQKHFDQTRELLVYLIYFFTEIVFPPILYGLMASPM